MIDENEIVQNLYTYKPYKERILFNYLRNEAIENDNFPKEKAISLWRYIPIRRIDWSKCCIRRSYLFNPFYPFILYKNAYNIIKSSEQWDQAKLKTPISIFIWILISSITFLANIWKGKFFWMLKLTGNTVISASNWKGFNMFNGQQVLVSIKELIKILIKITNIIHFLLTFMALSNKANICSLFHFCCLPWWQALFFTLKIVF